MIYAYNQGSQSAKELSQALGVRRIRHNGSTYKGSASKVVINWGSSSLPEEVMKSKVINNPDAVAKASNKLTFFETVKDKVNIPPFTTDKEEAKQWLDDGKIVVVREKLQGHSAEGLVLIEDEGKWNGYNHSRAKLYVKYIPKRDEYRVHVVNDEVVDVRRKALSSEANGSFANWKVRNHANGFIYAKNNVDAPEDVHNQSLAAIAGSGLDFGAVDVIWNEYLKRAFVLEINTAPGLEGSTIDSYADKFQDILNEGGPRAKRKRERMEKGEAPQVVLSDLELGGLVTTRSNKTKAMFEGLNMLFNEE